MSFPDHDPFWVATYRFIQQFFKSADRVVAPDIFWEKFPQVYSYKFTHSSSLPDHEWAVIHKGKLNEIDREFLQKMVQNYSPVFANEVFVIFSKYPQLPKVSHNSSHLQSFYEQLKKVPQNSPGIDLNERKTGIPSKAEKLVDFSTLSLKEIASEMNKIHGEGGYEFPKLYDQTSTQAIQSYVWSRIAPTTHQRILDLGCGDSRIIGAIEDCQELIGIDISEVAIAQLSKKFQDRENFKFYVGNASELNFPDRSFDLVMAVDVTEHVFDYQKLFQEAWRVLKPSGKLIFNCANRDSLHLRITRKMGYPEFKTNYQHIHEFTVSEIQSLMETIGFNIQEIKGMFLLPYWGVPGIDPYVRHLTDDDPEVIAMLKAMGDQVSPEYTYSFFVLCQKPD